MEISETNGCCGLLEISEFNALSTEENILREIKFFYEMGFEFNSEVPYAMFATTNQHQTVAEQALKALKFKATKFKSRHAVGNEKILTHWFRTTPPTKIMPWFRRQKRKAKRDNW
jgi:hypothetical protein